MRLPFPGHSIRAEAWLRHLGYTEKGACRLVGLSRSTYFKMKFRHSSDGEIRRLLLADAIADIHA